jgi:hypothetical protein
MKKIILFSTVVLGLIFSGCGDSSEPQGAVVVEPSIDIVKGFYYLGDDNNSDKKYYLDVDAAGTMHPYTYFKTAECAMSVEAGEKNFALKDKNVTLDKNTSKLFSMVDDEEIGWRYNDKNSLESVYIGDLNASGIIQYNDIILGIVKSPESLSSISCDSNFSARETIDDLLVGKTLFMAYHVEGNTTVSFLDEIKIGSDNNLTMNTITYSLVPNKTIIENNSTDYNLTNGEFKFYDDENVTCVLSKYNADSVTLLCHPDSNVSSVSSGVLWNTEEKAIENPISITP